MKKDTASRMTGKRTRKKSGRKRARSGLLWMIALSLALSALLRLGVPGGIAIAEGLSDNAGPVESQAECTTDEDVATLLKLLRDREAGIEIREGALQDREQALSIAETQVRKHLAALAQAESDLERMIALSSEAAEDDLSRLTSVYENMKPKQAALVFAEMSPEFAAGFLGRMRADAAAAIMAGLDPDKAYAISVLIAGRNANAPTE